MSRAVAMVVIGRNEGERLKRCLLSVQGRVALVVYVDSGSTDGSVEFARAQGAEVVSLDMTLPFTAARARNAGVHRANELMPQLRYVQFVDGDCEVVAGWLERALDFLESHPQVAAVCGRRRERHPERSVYNLLCDREWDTPVGDARACGGDAMMRADALQAVGGYREDLIAGEEPEMCVRLRAKGWRIYRLGEEMTLHDAAMTRFGQWWKRTVRNGYAFAEGAHLHGAPPERHWVRESRSAWVWGVAIPLAIALGAIVVTPWALALVAIYPLQMWRLSRYLDDPPGVRRWRAIFLVLAKFPEAAGQLKFMAHRWSGGPARLIEYK